MGVSIDVDASKALHIDLSPSDVSSNHAAANSSEAEQTEEKLGYEPVHIDPGEGAEALDEILLEMEAEEGRQKQQHQHHERELNGSLDSPGGDENGAGGNTGNGLVDREAFATIEIQVIDEIASAGHGSRSAGGNAAPLPIIDDGEPGFEDDPGESETGKAARGSGAGRSRSYVRVPNEYSKKTSTKEAPKGVFGCVFECFGL